MSAAGKADLRGQRLAVVHPHRRLLYASASVLVVVLAMSRVPTPVVHIVDMVPMRDCNMAAPLTVDMVMIFMHRVAGWLTFVVVILVLSMKVTAVDVVDMILVWDSDMAASFAMHMIMSDVLVVDCTGHRFSPSVANFDF